jgi:subtilisin family serine protease
MGPTADNRIKPDVAARGVTVATSSTAGLIGPQNGTSFSAPLVSGFAACLWQSNPNFSAQQIRDAIIKSAHQYQNPDSLLGYGIVNFQTAFDQFVGIQRFENNSSFSMYPNPAKEYIQLKINDADCTYKNAYKIYNTTGQVVLGGNLGGELSNLIYLHTLPQGMYYLSLHTQKGEITQRFIKH